MSSGDGFDADQDDRLAHRVMLFGGIGVEHDLARCRARRRWQAGRQHIARRIGIERRVQQLVERHRVDAQHRLFLGDQARFRHIDRNLQRGLRGALARTGLQHPELLALHGELDILHIAVMRFEDVEDVGELPVNLGHRLFHRQRLGPCPFARRQRQILRRADARNHILALRVDQELAIIGILAGRGVAGEGNARRRRLAHIAEHHRLHIDRGAPVAGDIVQAAIDLGAVRFPRTEHRADRAP